MWEHAQLDLPGGYRQRKMGTLPKSSTIPNKSPMRHVSEVSAGVRRAPEMAMA